MVLPGRLVGKEREARVTPNSWQNDSLESWGPGATGASWRKKGSSLGHQIPGVTSKKEGTLLASGKRSMSKEISNLVHIWIITDFYQYCSRCNLFSPLIILSSTIVRTYSYVQLNSFFRHNNIYTTVLAFSFPFHKTICTILNLSISCLIS